MVADHQVRQSESRITLQVRSRYLIFVRKANAPKPVCTSATKKFIQSSP
jgi:hypothetical protein